LKRSTGKLNCQPSTVNYKVQVATSLRVDPGQRFACSQCGRCCRGFDVVVSDEEIDFYRRRNASAWFRDTVTEGGARDLSAEAHRAKVEARRAKVDPFEPIPGLPGRQRIRKRQDGACGFLSDDNRCRIHEELGAAKKPLTCRLFPFAFRPSGNGVIVTASFNCPTIVANEGPLMAAADSLIPLESLRKEWFARHPWRSPLLRFAAGRAIDARSTRLLRENWLAMLKRDSADIRDNIRRIASTMDDLTRRRVMALADEDFHQYVALTVPHAAAKPDAPPSRAAGWIARMLQRGFLYAVAAIRADLERPGRSRTGSRLMRLRLLAHFHGLAPGLDRVMLGALQRGRVDINDPEIRPTVCHYLRSTLETLGSSGRPIVDEVAIAVSILNAAVALAAMNADAAGTRVDRAIFNQAMAEAADVSHASSAVLDWILNRLSGGTEALWYLAR
jgi:Fe-S-cluster containining protein